MCTRLQWYLQLVEVVAKEELTSRNQGAYPRPLPYLQLDVGVDIGGVRAGEEGEDEELLHNQLLNHQDMETPTPTTYVHKVTGKGVTLMWLRGKS